MNILVIGNGFDLAHGLPTKYLHFLEFAKTFMKCYQKEDEIDWVYWDESSKINKFVKKIFIAKYENGQTKTEKENARNLIEELRNCIDDNIWIEYFRQCDMYLNENWIDFESKISDIIQALDNDMHSALSGNHSINDKTNHLSNAFLVRYFSYNTTFKQARDYLQRDLLKLIRALEIYLVEFVEKAECNSISPDIKDIKVDRVLSFNYTNTYEKIYGNSGIEFDYIHGKADINHTIETNNMVLGIDEYLSPDRRNKDVEFIAFKKFYQRIHKQTGCKYKEWVDEIKQDYFDYLQRQEVAKQREQRYISDSMQRMMNELAVSAIKEEDCSLHHLYIFGHSLDSTDKDILRDLILNKNVYTTIYYLNKDVMGQQIANLVKVIGQDELIKRTGGNTKTIEFKQQQDMG